MNWGYLQQQAIAFGLATLIAGIAIWLLGRVRGLREPVAARLLLELPLVGTACWFVGHNADRLGYDRFLPGLALYWFIGVALTFYWLAVLWPLRVLWLRGKLGDRPSASIARGLAFGLPAVAGWACFVEPLLLDVERVELTYPELAADREVRIAHVSDLQMIGHGYRESSVVDAVNAFAPHVIVLTGDYITARIDDEPTIAAARDVLAGFQASHGVFATVSDSDTFEQRQRIFRDLGIRYLINGNDVVDVDGQRVRVCCLNHIVPRWDRTTAGATDEELVVVASHVPDLAAECGERVPLADLFLCGHTHGGQLQIPGYGPPVTFSTVPRRIAAGGVFETPTQLTYAVSRGVGMEGNYAPRFRLNCRPHVFLFTLRGAATPTRASGSRR